MAHGDKTPVDLIAELYGLVAPPVTQAYSGTIAPAMAPYLTPANILSVLVALNFAAFAMFGIDKARAERGTWRVRESTLLWLAALGGSPGAYAGRRLFRHKTRKQPFSRALFHVVVLQVMVAGTALWLLYGR